MKKIIYSLTPVLFLAFLFGNPIKVLAATLILSPASKSVTVGQTITVDILLDTQGAGIDGVDVYSLHYNSSILEVVDANSGTSGIQITPGSLLPITLTNTVSNGIIQFSQVSSGGTSYTGSGKLATITFKGLSNGTSAVTFDFAPGSTSDSNVAGGGQDKLSSVGNGSYTVSGGTGVPPPTPTPLPGDVTPPVISTITSSNIKSSSATIIWTTDEGSTSKIDYGLTSSYGLVSTLNSSMVTLHSQLLSGLASNSTYHFRVRSQDSAGNLSVSGDNTFQTSLATSNTTTTTTPPPVTTTTSKPPTTTTTGGATTGGSPMPKISLIRSPFVGTSTVTITWVTDGPADSQLQYGLTDLYDLFSAKDSSLVTAHSITLSGLSGGTTYHYRVRSNNEFGKLAFSDDRTFTTLKERIVKRNIFEKFILWIISLFD